MEVQYNNLYTHFVFTTQDRFPAITEIHRERIEKYITGIVENKGISDRSVVEYHLKATKGAYRNKGYTHNFFLLDIFSKHRVFPLSRFTPWVHF